MDKDYFLNELGSLVHDKCSKNLADNIMAIVPFIAEAMPTIHAIPIEKVKALVEQLNEEREYAYANFEEYKESVLGIEADELPEDEFRYGVERCMQLLNKLIAESEVDNGNAKPDQD